MAIRDHAREELEEGRDLDAVLAFLDDPAGEQGRWKEGEVDRADGGEVEG